MWINGTATTRSSATVGAYLTGRSVLQFGQNLIMPGQLHDESGLWFEPLRFGKQIGIERYLKDSRLAVAIGAPLQRL